MDLRKILESVRDGSLKIEDAEGMLRREPYENLGYARVDTDRGVRTGVPEVVFCPGKSDGQLTGIFRTIYEREGAVLGTRADAHQAELIKGEFSEASYDPVSRILKIEGNDAPRRGLIAVCTAGTSDIPVAEEAAQTAEFLGSRVSRIYDIGVSGLHRLLANLGEIQKANCVIAAAGMEGALASVLGGLVSRPVIAVPTSVGYGASMHGISALLTMINSCANGIAVVNIDNGYGAGYIASQINLLGAENE